jgi:hypothetical protein
MSAGGIAFDTSETFENKNLVLISIFLEPRFPQPLNVVGRINRFQGEQEQMDNARRVVLNFCSLNETVQTLLEKYIFRNHRRMVAQAKHKPANINK